VRRPPSSRGSSTKPDPGARFPHPASPEAALAVLAGGNARYRDGRLELRDFSPVSEQIAAAQQPFAAIITCADSRISPTLIFDVAPGNLFVSRVIGNLLETGTLGSTEYAVAKLGVKVVVVMGHSDCGAVKAALQVADGTVDLPTDRDGSIGALVGVILPVIHALPGDERTPERVTLANAAAQAQAIADSGPVIAAAVADGKVLVVSAVYDIASGRVGIDVA
jgi:carbonic anhydrase